MSIVNTSSNHLIRTLKRTEKHFSRNHYQGGGKDEFVIKSGNIPIMVSAPHAVSHYRDGQTKNADMLTGSLALFLHECFNCHIIYKTKYAKCDPNYDNNDNGENLYQTKLRDYVSQNGIKLLIDLHGAAKSKPYALEMGTAPVMDVNGNLVGEEDPSLHGNTFVINLIRYSLEFAFSELETDIKDIWKNKIFSAGLRNTITKYISQNTSCACIQLEINGLYRDLSHPEPLLKLVEGFSIVFGILKNIDWTTNNIQVYRLWQSFVHKPQDKVELLAGHTNGLHNIMSHLGETEIVRLHKANDKSLQRLRQHYQERADMSAVSYPLHEEEYVFLTNRLIENLWHREWIQGNETQPSLCGIPVLVYEAHPERLRMGMVKADQVDAVCFSSNLYESMLPDSKDFDFIVFNRSTDSKLYIDFSKANYEDKGRIKSPRVMIPRYYKSLLGLYDYPMSVVRKEELSLLTDHLNNDIAGFLNDVYDQDGDTIHLNVEKLSQKDGNTFYGLLQKLIPDIESVLSETRHATDLAKKERWLQTQCDNLLSSSYTQTSEEVFCELVPGLENSEEGKLLKEKTYEIEKHYGWYDFVEILKIRKQDARPHDKNFKYFIDRIRQKFLNIVIGNTEYCMKTRHTNQTDDKNNVSRLSRNMMNLLGVSENDKIVIKYGERKAVVRVLEGEQYSDSDIGIPAPIRKTLGMNSINDIVVIHRDMRYIFKRHSQEQTVAIIGTVLAVFQVVNNILVGVILCILFIPLILYFALNEERIKVK